MTVDTQTEEANRHNDRLGDPELGWSRHALPKPDAERLVDVCNASFALVVSLCVAAAASPAAQKWRVGLLQEQQLYAEGETLK